MRFTAFGVLPALAAILVSQPAPREQVGPGLKGRSKAPGVSRLFPTAHRFTE